MTRTACIIALLFGSLACRAGAQQQPSGAWPGKMSNEERAKLRPLYDEFLQAMRAHDDKRLAATREEIVRRMGKYAGVSEFAPDYGKPVDPSPPDLAKVETLWRQSFKRMQGRNGWERAPQAKAQGRPQPRLRVSFRGARAYLHSYEAGLEGRDEFMKAARQGFDYIASQQAGTGAFGYPYFPNATEGLVAAAARVVKQGEARGLKMTEGDLDAARRAAEWAIKRPLVANFDYNGFSGVLLARLYRVTGEKRYLDEAAVKFKFGVLPGQMANGRWFDQHNAAIQYHAIMMSQLMELYLALQKAKDPYAAEVKRRIALGLDRLAEEITTHGATRYTAQEMLCLDALVRGLLLFGANEKWERAAHVDVNYLCNQFLLELEKRGEPMTETIAHYLLYRRVKTSEAAACEIEIEKCLAARKKR